MYCPILKKITISKTPKRVANDNASYEEELEDHYFQKHNNLLLDILL